jgi:Ca-activated chloride channel family protein
VAFRLGGSGSGGGEVPPVLAPAGGQPNAPAKKVTDFLKEARGEGRPDGDDKAGLGGVRRKFEDQRLAKRPTSRPAKTDPSGKAVPDADAEEEATVARALGDAQEKVKALDRAREALLRSRLDEVQAGRLGVDLSLQTESLRRQSRLTPSAVRRAAGHGCLEVGGVWIDEGFTVKMPTVTVRAMSKAYFRILERQPSMREVFRLGNYLVWVTPSGTALVVDTNDGRSDMTDADIDRLFTAAKK